MSGKIAGGIVALLVLSGCTKPSAPTGGSKPESKSESTQTAGQQVTLPTGTGNQVGGNTDNLPVKEVEKLPRHEPVKPTMKTVAGSMKFNRSGFNFVGSFSTYFMTADGKWTSIGIGNSTSGTWSLTNEKLTMVAIEQWLDFGKEHKVFSTPIVYCKDAPCKFNEEGQLTGCSEFSDCVEGRTFYDVSYQTQGKK